MGEFDVLVGINLLREGLDLPEVSLVSILDADKEGFLRSGTSLIQTIGRAARNVSGQVHMYADKITDSMAQGDRRDQPARGPSRSPTTSAHGVDPQPLRKQITDITELLAREDADTEELHRRRRPPAVARQGAGAGPVVARTPGRHAARRSAGCRAADLADLIQQLTDQMHLAAGELQFELAARLRDEIGELKKELRGMRRRGRRSDRQGRSAWQSTSRWSSTRSTRLRWREFWAEAAGYVVQPPPDGLRLVGGVPGRRSAFRRTSGTRPRRCVDPTAPARGSSSRRCPRPRPSRTGVHVDLKPGLADRRGPRATEVAERTRAARRARRDESCAEHDDAWASSGSCCTDPEGNEFCVS